MKKVKSTENQKRDKSLHQKYQNRAAVRTEISLVAFVKTLLPRGKCQGESRIHLNPSTEYGGVSGVKTVAVTEGVE